MLYAADKIVWERRKGKKSVGRQSAKYEYSQDLVRDQPPKTVDSEGNNTGIPTQFMVSKMWLKSYVDGDNATFVPAPNKNTILGEIPDAMLLQKDLASIKVQEQAEIEAMEQADDEGGGDEDS